GDVPLPRCVPGGDERGPGARRAPVRHDLPGALHGVAAGAHERVRDRVGHRSRRGAARSPAAGARLRRRQRPLSGQRAAAEPVDRAREAGRLHGVSQSQPLHLRGPGHHAARVLPAYALPARASARGAAHPGRYVMLTPLVLALALDSGFAIVPRPVHLTPKSGSFTLTGSTAITTDAASRAFGFMLADYLFPATGFRLVVRSSAPPPGVPLISLGLGTTLRTLGDEGYRLDVSRSRVTIRAARPAGAFYALQTLRQLFPTAILREAQVAGTAWTIPAVSIEDYPRFSWRGMHLDVGRHFMPKRFVKKYIDLLALHKMNRFHWHLTEDQGWRIEIKQYPRLTAVGAWRRETIVGRPDRRDSTTWRFDGQPHGGFYTQDDIREVVAYAQTRFVTLVPESE